MSEPFYVASLSGGKDSCAMVIRLVEEGWPLDAIVAADQGRWWEQAYEAIHQVEVITGRKVTIIEPPKSWDYLMFDHILTKGPRKGTEGYGWPFPTNRWCNTFLKARPLDKYFKELAKDREVVNYIGIAADEPERTKKEGGVMKIAKRFPLVEWGMTEADCLEYCHDRGINFGGLYDHFPRLACWCCPLQTLDSLRALYHYYPDKWEELKDMDKRSRNLFRQVGVDALEQRFKKEDANG